MKKHDEERRRILFIGNFAYSSTKTIASGAIRRLQDCPGVTLHIVGAHPYDEYGKYPVSTDCDGVITCCRMENPMARGLARRRPAIPFVFVLDPCPWPSLQPRSLSIVCDDRAIAAEAADLFVRHDLREFGYVGSRLEHANTGWDAARREAFASRLAEHGFSARAYSPTGRSDEEESAALAAWLRALPKPCGLFVAYDQRARRVLEICRVEGISVPEQIQVIGVDNESWICESIRPTLSSIEPDFEGAGYRAAEALLEMMGGALTWNAAVPAAGTQQDAAKMAASQAAAKMAAFQPAAKMTAFQPAAKMAAFQPAAKMAAFPGSATFGVRRVVQRMSTIDAHGSAGRAVRARDYIRTHVGEPFSVPMLAKRLGCSLRTLQLSYRTVFGTTVAGDIAESRLDKAKELLEGSDTPVGEIGKLVGFASQPHFARVFKARTGMSLAAWRRHARPHGSLREK